VVVVEPEAIYLGQQLLQQLAILYLLVLVTMILLLHIIEESKAETLQYLE
jgi:hypothetical protein